MPSQATTVESSPLPQQIEDALVDGVEAGKLSDSAFVESLCERFPSWTPRILATIDALVLLDSVTAGDRIGPYRVVRALGRGGMGAVFLAEQDEPVQRQVAVKVIKAGMDSAALVLRFRQERQALAWMEHDAIAKVYDCGATEAGRPYFAMEYVGGMPLTDYCDRQRLTLRERLRLLQQVCEAVAHAHRKGVVHRDLKPSNVLVREVEGRPSPKVIDFGLAKVVTGSQWLRTGATALGGELFGTPEYMAPEQAEPGADVDTRADVYSLGVMLYEQLTGELPVASEQLRKAGYEHMLGTLRDTVPDRPSTRWRRRAEHSDEVAACRGTSAQTLGRQLRGDLDSMAMMALDKDREQRYASADALAGDIGRYLANEPLLAGPKGAGYRLRKLVRRHRGAFAAAALVLLTLVGGMIATYRQYLRAEDKAAESEEVTAFLERRWQEVAIGDVASHIRQALMANVAEEQGEPLAAALATTDLNAVASQVLVEGLLAPSLAALERDYAGRPLFQARLLQSLAAGWHYAGLPGAVESVQAKALAIREEQLGADARETITSTLGLGLTRQRAGKYGEAAELFDDALARAESSLGLDDDLTVDVLSARGVLHFLQGHHEDAERTAREVVERKQRRHGERAVDIVVPLKNLGALLVDLERAKEGLPLLHRARELAAEHYAPHFSIRLWVEASFARCLEELGRFDEALAAHRTVLNGRRESLSESHPEVLTAWRNLGGCHLLRGELPEAIRCYGEALTLQREVLGDLHPETLRSMQQLALCHTRNRDLAAAEPLLIEAFEGRTKVLGPDHRLTLLSLNNLARYRYLKREFEDCERAYRELVDRGRSALGSDDAEFLNYLKNLGIFLRSQSKWDQAEPVLREAVQGLYRVRPGTVRMMDAARNLGIVLARQQRWADAVEVLGDFEAAARACYDDDDREQLAEWLEFLGVASFRAAEPDFARAAATLLEAHGMWVSLRGEQAPRTLGVVGQVAALFSERDAAEPGKGHAATAASWRARLPEGKR